MPFTTNVVSEKTKGLIWADFIQRMEQYGGITILGQVSSALESSSSAAFNRILARQDAYISEQEAEIDEKLYREKLRAAVGSMIATAGASGFSLESPSTQQAIDALVRSGEMDAAIIRIRGDIGSARAKLAADMESSAARQALVSGIVNIFGTAAAIYGKSVETHGEQIKVKKE